MKNTAIKLLQNTDSTHTKVLEAPSMFGAEGFEGTCPFVVCHCV